MNSDIKKVIEVLNQGGIVIFPTDTAFGIGCRIDRVDAVKRLFRIRKRPLNQPTPVLVSSFEMAKNYIKNSTLEIEEKLIKPFWPGALTIVFESQNNKVLELTRGGTNTVGIRMPNHNTILQLIEAVGVPILGPSANFHGSSTPFNIKDLDKNLVNLVDFVLPGECLLKNTSTVIDVTVNPWKILRQGAITITIDK